MKFIALDINVGDSFVLKQNANIFVVDGGKCKSTIVSKLTNNKISKIDVLICTHYDADHVNGIIAIMKSKKIDV